MSLWWILEADRFNKERQDIANLGEKSEWLKLGTWRLANDIIIEMDFEINHGNNNFPMTLQYPNHFPSIPPLIIPKSEKRVSSHQYGVGGELCLEYRSDNWEKHITGANMIESAYHLIAGERPIEGKGVVPSVHSQSIGQKTRGAQYRFILEYALVEKMYDIPLDGIETVSFIENCLVSTYSAMITSFGKEGSTNHWNRNKGKYRQPYSAIAFRTSKVNLDTENPEQYIKELLLSKGHQDIGEKIESGQDLDGIFLIDDEGIYFLFSVHPEGKPARLIPYRIIFVRENEKRLPESYKSLTKKTVGIIGCGSLGSKVAVSLARSGVKNFLLIDDDLLMPGNIIRHELDNSLIGQHKADALKSRIKKIDMDCNVSTRHIALGKQESTGSISTALGQLADCDLLIDATADPQGFNFCSICAEKSGKPMIWAEVFSGGVGGLIARSRPDKDPPPQNARNQILSWCEKYGEEWVGISYEYDIERENQPPLIADDSDVSVIAAFTTKFAVDLLTRPEESIFPVSAYMIGLKQEWIFTQPFDTRPIELVPKDWEKIKVADASEVQEAIRFVTNLLPKKETENENNSTG